MQITNELPQTYPTPTNQRRTEASEFDASGNYGGNSSHYRRQRQPQPPTDAAASKNETLPRELPAIKPGVASSGGGIWREVPAYAAENASPGAGGPITPEPMLRRRSEAYERMLNIF